MQVQKLVNNAIIQIVKHGQALSEHVSTGALKLRYGYRVAQCQ